MKHMYVIAVLISMLLISGASLGESTSTLEKIKNSETIYIGYRKTEVPMSFLSEDKQPVGYTIDLCTHIVHEVRSKLKNPNIAVKYVPLTASDRFKALENNSIDLLCGSTTKTISRSERVDFSQLTFVTGATLLSLKTAKVDGISGLEGKTVAVGKDTTTLDALKKSLKEAGINAKIIIISSPSDGINALVNGNADAFASDQIILIGQLLTHQDAGKFTIADSLFSYEPFALAVRKDDSEFRLIADSVLSRLYRSGAISSIYSKWFGAYIKEVPSLLEAMYILNSTPE
jgi:glutamate/aspartate transport system substrate-binding protein